MSREIVLWFPAQPVSVTTARRRVRNLGFLPPEASHRLALVCSELVARAVDAGPASPGRCIEVRLGREPGLVRVVVHRTDAASGAGDGAVDDLRQALVEATAASQEFTADGGWAVVQARDPAQERATVPQ